MTPGFVFTGHTEFLAARTAHTPGGHDACGWRHAGGACHHPSRAQSVLEELPGKAWNRRCASCNATWSSGFAISRRGIAVAGLNPHAGERRISWARENRRHRPGAGAVAQGRTRTDRPLARRHLYSIPNGSNTRLRAGDVSRPGPARCLIRELSVRASISRWAADHSAPRFEHGTALDLAGSGKAEVGSLKRGNPDVRPSSSPAAENIAARTAA